MKTTDVISASYDHLTKQTMAIGHLVPKDIARNTYTNLMDNTFINHP